ncbi:putative cytochrome P450 [Viridothelium virens]|uniref:Putative cytochrome P450 n=1 Tax=Viridothelium virens TaxID=1048519 RepID=A0A6A6GT77_VIRVR|nr:putative cytochrome P450 [Viridothelium virens]
MSLFYNSCVLLAGAATHMVYLHRSEHHMQGLRYLQLLVLVPSTYVTFTTITFSIPIDATLYDALTLVILYLSGLYTSLIIYRLFFSPLRHFPGPLGSRISNLYLSLHLIKLTAHTKLLSLHDTYGSFVRIGSSDLSITHPKAVQAIYGPQSQCTKADWYDLTLPMVSMQTTRNRDLHDERRRIWSRAFGEKSMRDYEDRLRVFQDQLMSRLGDAASQSASTNVTELFNLYTFDVMGDLAFGEGFGMLRSNELHWAVRLVGQAMTPMGLMLPSWMFRLLIGIPFATKGWWSFIRYCCEKLDERMDKKEITSDILHTLLKPYHGTKPSGTELNVLQGDTQLIIVAGSDTTATTLACLFYELVQKPEHIGIIRREVGAHVRPNGEIPHQPLQYLEHLNAVINETLRLHPPVGTGLQRTTPPEGLDIGDTYIPGNTTVSCPQYVIGRSEAIYKNARDFIPERWYESSSLVKEKGAYAPFSAGPYNCIGRPLALLNLRTTVAKLLNRYDVCFADGEDGTALERDMKTHFTAAAGALYLRFAERKVGV